MKGFGGYSSLCSAERENPQLFQSACNFDPLIMSRPFLPVLLVHERAGPIRTASAGRPAGIADMGSIRVGGRPDP